MKLPNSRRGTFRSRLRPVLLEALEVRVYLTTTTALRIAAYNVAADIYSQGITTVPEPAMETVLEAIGDESIGGVSRPLDILGLEETTSNAVTVTPMVDALNAHYGAGVYAESSYQATTDGTTDGNGPNALIYNTHTLTLIASVGIGTPSTTGFPRQPVRYEFCPVGGSAADDFYVYVSHYKSGDKTQDNNGTRRGDEAQAIRANGLSLPATARVLYIGDYNLNDPLDPGYAGITAAGQGQGFDPINSPYFYGSSTPRSTETETATSLDSRLDLELATQNVLTSQNGLYYVAGSYQAFGNNGSVSDVADSNNTALAGLANRTTVLEDLTLVSDHLPVVADYTDTITPAADPIIGSLSLSASSVNSGVPATATAENVIDAGTGTITGVSFYMESNGVSGLQPGSDAFVGTGTQNGTSWSTAIDTAGHLPGTYTYYAVATDSFGASSPVVSAPLDVAGIVLPAWVDSSSAATWDAGSNTLTVTGAATIIGDPGLANAPSIIASGAGAQVTVAPTDGSQVIHLGALSLSGGATLSIPHVDASRVTLAVGMPGGPASVFGVDSSTLDIADNILIVEASPDDITQQLASVQQAVQAGKGNGSWTGTGITSWTVAADVAAGTNQTFHTTVAIADNGAFRVPFTSYGGQAVDATSIIITQSLVADGDFNGTVDNADLVTLLIHFGLDNQSQSSGDYDGNGNVDNADLVALLTDFGQQL